MYKFVIIILLIISVFFLACTKENPDSIDFFSGKEYFPLETGNCMIYKITKITVDKPSNLYDTSIYYIKELVDISLIDNENDTAYRIERYKRLAEDDAWQIHAVWTAKNIDNSAEKIEENQRFVKIRFPVKIDLRWDGNLFNELESKDYRISGLNHYFQIGNFVFDSCLTVVHDSSSSLIHKDLSYEVYAYRKGLVYKEETYLNSQEVIFEVPVEERVTTGTIFIQELVGIGNDED